MFWEVDQWNVALCPSLFHLLNAKLIQYVPWDLKKNHGTDRSSMFCFAADPERLPDCDDAALNFPINIRRASNFQTGPLSEDDFPPFFPLSPSECRQLPLDNSIGKQAKQSCPLTESGPEWHSALWRPDKKETKGNKRADRPRRSPNYSNNQCWSVLSDLKCLCRW